MPWYEYVCPSCGERFDLMRSIADRDKSAACPACGTEAKRALPHVQAVIAGGGAGAPPSCGASGGG
ncbi:MAG: zinc ribbon domain-containing protein [Candidatus Eisenbacteria bacterium]|nr:zinc ribbon domain-containing protein [Candidatus Eisenbacteria bacterium]